MVAKYFQLDLVRMNVLHIDKEKGIVQAKQEE